MHGGSGGCLSFAKSLQKFLNDLNEAVAPCVTGKDGAVVQHDPEDADALFEAIKNTVPCAQRIGTVVEKQEKRIIVRR